MARVHPSYSSQYHANSTLRVSVYIPKRRLLVASRLRSRAARSARRRATLILLLLLIWIHLLGHRHLRRRRLLLSNARCAIPALLFASLLWLLCAVAKVLVAHVGRLRCRFLEASATDVGRVRLRKTRFALLRAM